MTIKFFNTLAISFFLLSLSTATSAKNEHSLITYNQALKAMDAAETYARQKGWNVTILVTDQNAKPVMLRRMDGAFIRSLDFATSKALVVTQTNLSSGEYATQVKAGKIKEIEGGTNYKGGVPIYLEGKLIGAITVSGVKDFQDEEVAIAGAKTIGQISKN
jgi:uncharacterized protein GlcG (DUF336 family)